MNVRPVDPRDANVVHNDVAYRVYFWSGTPQHGLVSDEHEVTGADVPEVLQWADDNARGRTYSVHVVVPDPAARTRRVTLVRLAGWEADSGDQGRPVHAVTVPAASAKRGVGPFIEKHVSNRAMRAALRVGIAPRTFALLETTGRTTGRRRLTPVGNGLDGETFWLVSERGFASAYVRNLQARPTVRVKVGRRWRSGTASIVADDDPWARRAAIDEANGLMGRFDGVIFRASATTPVTIRIDLDV